MNQPAAPVLGYVRAVAYSGMRTEVVAPDSWRVELSSFKEFQRAAGKPASTIKLRDYHLRRFAVQVGKPPFEVDLGDMVAHLSRSGWSPNTRRGVRTTLTAFYRWARISGRADRHIAEDLPTIPVDAGKPRPASDEAVDFGLAGADARVELMIRLGAQVGLRCCEIAAVSTEDITGRPGAWSLRVLGKGGKKRVVPISDDVAYRIRERGPGFVFPGQIDGHLSSGYVSKLISHALPVGTTAHPLRHRFASRAFKGSGNNLRAVQELLGHASIATTQIYTAVDDDDLRRAAIAAA